MNEFYTYICVCVYAEEKREIFYSRVRNKGRRINED